MNHNAADKAQVLAIHPNASVLATGLGSAIDLNDYTGEIAFLLDADNIAGTNPTLLVKIQDCATSGGSYADVAGGAFTALAALASAQKLSIKKELMQRYIKVSFTIGGTSDPEYIVSLVGVAWKKYG
jgi:hypothetical protein